MLKMQLIFFPKFASHMNFHKKKMMRIKNLTQGQKRKFFFWYEANSTAYLVKNSLNRRVYRAINVISSKIFFITNMKLLMSKIKNKISDFHLSWSNEFSVPNDSNLEAAKPDELENSNINIFWINDWWNQY